MGSFVHSCMFYSFGHPCAASQRPAGRPDGNYDNGRASANLNETILTPAAVKTSNSVSYSPFPSTGKFTRSRSISRTSLLPVMARTTSSSSPPCITAFLLTMPTSPVRRSGGESGSPGTFDRLRHRRRRALHRRDSGNRHPRHARNRCLHRYLIRGRHDPGERKFLSSSARARYQQRRGEIWSSGCGDRADHGTGDSSSGGVVPFVSSQHLQRPALLLANGTVYVSFGSHGDSAPWHGWMLGYSAANVQTAPIVYNSTPNGSGGSFWQSGRGPAGDSSGNIFVVPSNGDSDQIRISPTRC